MDTMWRGEGDNNSLYPFLHFCTMFYYISYILLSGDNLLGAVQDLIQKDGPL